MKKTEMYKACKMLDPEVIYSGLAHERAAEGHFIKINIFWMARIRSDLDFGVVVSIP